MQQVERRNCCIDGTVVSQKQAFRSHLQASLMKCCFDLGVQDEITGKPEINARVDCRLQQNVGGD